MYQFRRCDNDELIEVDFETMMGQDTAGFITVELEGMSVSARRVRDGQTKQTSKAPREIKPILSDSLGIPDYAAPEYTADIKKHGIRGVEFVPDPLYPQFLQAKCDSPATYLKYAKHRGHFDQNSKNGSGTIYAAGQLEKATEMLLRQYDETGALPITAPPEKRRKTRKVNP